MQHFALDEPDTGISGGPSYRRRPQCPNCHGSSWDVVARYRDRTVSACTACGHRRTISHQAARIHVGKVPWFSMKTAEEDSLEQLRGRGYNTDDWKKWHQGHCGTYACALMRMDPRLRFGTAGYTDKGGGDASEGWTPVHHFAHDDHYAYDAAGRHPLPYYGVHGGLDYAELDDDPEDHGLPDAEAGPEGSDHHIAQAMEHARRHGILEGRFERRAAVVPTHRFVQNSPTPGDPYRCTHPKCAEDWRPGQAQPTSRCPAETSTADILAMQAEQEARLEELNGESGDEDGDEPGEGGEDQDQHEDPVSSGHEAMISSLGNLVDAGAWHAERGRTAPR